MPIEAPGPVSDVTRPTVMSAACAGRATNAATAAAPATRKKFRTQTSHIDGGEPATTFLCRSLQRQDILSLKQFRHNGFMSRNQRGGSEMSLWSKLNVPQPAGFL